MYSKHFCVLELILIENIGLMEKKSNLSALENIITLM